MEQIIKLLKELSKVIVSESKPKPDPTPPNIIAFNKQKGRTTLVLKGQVYQAQLDNEDTWNEKIGLLVVLIKAAFSPKKARQIINFGYRRYKVKTHLEVFFETILLTKVRDPEALINLLNNFKYQTTIPYGLTGVVFKIHRK